MIANTCNYYYCFLNCCSVDSSGSSATKLGFSSFNSFNCGLRCSGLDARSDFFKPVKAMESSRTSHIEANNIHGDDVSGNKYYSCHLVYVYAYLFAFCDFSVRIKCCM